MILPVPAEVLLAICLFLGATLYTSVGHAGASAYIAAMALFGVAPAVMRPTALVLNILVAGLTTFRYMMVPPVPLAHPVACPNRSGSGSLRDIDWTERRWNSSQAYSESKLHVATLAAATARRWPEVLSNAVDPGWVPTKMGGAGAPDDLEMGHLTQTWLAVSDDPAAKISGGYWYHRQQVRPAMEVTDPAFQDQLLDRLAELTGVRLS
jgi:NAD(P)-dependent dehydrogenase (short-subunit alcohol dehydrogenase family)